MSSREKLELELDGAPAAVAALSEDEAADLLELFASARRQERTLLAEAIDTVTGALPWPFGASAKKMMFGRHLS